MMQWHVPRLTVVSGVALLVVIGTSGCTQGVNQAGSDFRSTVVEQAAKREIVSIGGHTYTVDLAVTPQEQRRGLAGRTTLAQGEGMLFILPEEQRPAFWMKGMKIPIDIVWIDAHRAIVGIEHNVPVPEEGVATTDLPTYSPLRPVRYVLELSAGTARAHELHIGDKVAGSVIQAK